MSLPRYSSLLLTLSASIALADFSLASELDVAETHLVHQHHLHRYGNSHPTVPPSQAPERYSSTRVGARELRLPANENTSDDEFTFAIFGDRTSGPVDGVNILANAVRDTNLIDPDLVMTIGDAVQGYNDAPQWMEQMKEYRDIMDQLRSPWFPTVGNHDVYWRGSKGQVAPKGGNSALYEKHLAPVWYAFEHKKCWFIVLYGDEGHPETGKQTFGEPESQKMSEAQFQWLDATLKKASGASHVFLFIHHPRWTKGNYGDDWERVHQRLVEAKNVSAVFAGHIHHMQYQQKRDNIEYLTMAATGGSLPANSQTVTRQHHIDVVRVRKDQISLVGFPVTAAMDVREITRPLALQLGALHRVKVSYPQPLVMPAKLTGEAVKRSLQIDFNNPTDEPITFLAKPKHQDPRWHFETDVWNSPITLAPQESRSFVVNVVYHAENASDYDKHLDLPSLVLSGVIAAKGADYRMDDSVRALPIQFDVAGEPNHALQLDGQSQWLNSPSRLLPVKKTLTVETRFKAEKLQGRQGLVAKTQGSDYGLHLQDDSVCFLIFLGDRYARVTTPKGALKLGQWHHVAGVYDGKEVRLYVDGKKVDAKAASGPRKVNALPLIVGADPDEKVPAVDPFFGAIDEVRISTAVRYKGEEAPPKTDSAANAQDLLWFQFNKKIGNFYPDMSGKNRHLQAEGDPKLVPVP